MFLGERESIEEDAGENFDEFDEQKLQDYLDPTKLDP